MSLAKVQVLRYAFFPLSHATANKLHWSSSPEVFQHNANKPLSIPCPPASVDPSLIACCTAGLVGRMHPLADTSRYQANGLGELRRKSGQSPADLSAAQLCICMHRKRGGQIVPSSATALNAAI